MTTLTWVWVGVVSFAGLALVAVVWNRSRAALDIEVERASRPEALADADLIYVEKRFSVVSPLGLIAKVDRGYRMRDGTIVLVEFQTRWVDQIFMSDVIQLSAQRMAVRGQTRRAVAPHGYVVVKTRSRNTRRTTHRVELMSEDEVAALARRREDILGGRIAPQYSNSPKMCRRCGFRSQCDGAAIADAPWPATSC